MKKRTDKEFLLDMFTACEKILRYTENLRYFDEFQRDEKTIDAVIRNIEVLGEAAKIFLQNLGRSIQKLSGA